MKTDVIEPAQIQNLQSEIPNPQSLMLLCTAIPHGSPEYEQTIRLRSKVLIHPLGLSFTPAMRTAEASDFHLTCSSAEGELLACMILTPESTSSVRMRQVAVSPEKQREGIGTELVRFSEEFARANGFTLMTMHARDTAIPFYERLGYERYGEPFEEVSIPHWKMRKELSIMNAEL